MIDELQRSRCHLCDIVIRGYGDPYRALFPGDAPEAEVLARSENYVVLADIGPIVEGYALIVPVRHVVSFQEESRSRVSELSSLLARVSAAQERCYGIRSTVFEHGSAGRGESARGCCIAHAHLHVVPFEGNLVPEELDANFQPLSGLTALVERDDGDEYLLVGSLSTGWRLWPGARAPQQFFRRRLAAAVRKPIWSWTDYVLLADANQTKETIRRGRDALARELNRFLDTR